MKRVFAVAAVLLASTAAHAGDSYTFDVGGHTVHIDAPSNCRSASCVSISVPGVFETKRSKRSRVKDDDDIAKTDAPIKATEPQTAVAPPPAPAASVATVSTPAPIATTAPVEQASVAPAPSYAPVQSSPAPQPVQSSPAPVAAAPAPVQNTVNAAAPVTAPVQKQQAPAPANIANSPLGVWLTEEKEGKVRIEQCGTNLCGYSVNAKTDANGDEVLINMKPTTDLKWAGRIFDPNSGSTYDSTIALKNANTLRVQGCAFGGMFCGGQTWSRVN